MVNACKIPVTAKTRIGFDDTEEFDYLNNFILKMKGVLDVVLLYYMLEKLF